MLRATRRILRPGGRIAFTVIHLAEGLSREQRSRAVAAGPAAVTTRSPSYVHLLRSAGFRDVGAIDVTEDFLSRLRDWLRYAGDHEDELVAAQPDFSTSLEQRFASRGAVEAGLLRRSLLFARVDRNR